MGARKVVNADLDDRCTAEVDFNVPGSCIQVAPIAIAVLLKAWREILYSSHITRAMFSSPSGPC